MYSRQRSNVKKRVSMALLIFFLLILGVFLIKTGKYFTPLFQLFFQNEIQLKKTSDNRVNILLLGVGGGTHDGPDLTDTMIFVSADLTNKKVTLVSIPRDLWIPELKQKINTAYTLGEEKQKGGGLMLAKATVSHLLNQQIDYAVKIDFNGFVKAVDMVGGLDITVDNTLDDYQYPIEGKENDSCGHNDTEIASLSAQLEAASVMPQDSFPCRYEHLHFDKGLQKMDGITALKFVRSRHAEGEEGSDFARSKRQEKVITAFKNKVFSVNTFLNPIKVVGLVNLLSGSIDTDIKTDEYDDFIKLAERLKGAKINSTVLDIGDDQTGRIGLLLNPPISSDYNNAYVLIPTSGVGDYTKIQDYVSCEIKLGNCDISKNGVIIPTPQVSVKKN